MVLARNHYFQGRLLSANDLESEQNHLREKQHFRNLYTFWDNKRGRESFLDRVTSHSAKDGPCHAARALLMETWSKYGHVCVLDGLAEKALRA